MTREWFEEAAATLHHHYGTEGQLYKAHEEIVELYAVLNKVLPFPQENSAATLAPAASGEKEKQNG